MSAIQYKPNSATYNPNTHEVIEAYIKSKFTETTVPKQSEIKFDFTLEDKTPDKPGIDYALKCYYNGFEDSPHTANYQTIHRVDKVRIHIEGKSVMNNRQKDIPVNFIKIRDIIQSAITGDSTALYTSNGIYQMYVTKGDAIEEVYKKDARNIFAMDIFCECHYLLGRVITP